MIIVLTVACQRLNECWQLSCQGELFVAWLFLKQRYHNLSVSSLASMWKIPSSQSCNKNISSLYRIFRKYKSEQLGSSAPWSPSVVSFYDMQDLSDVQHMMSVCLGFRCQAPSSYSGHKTNSIITKAGGNPHCCHDNETVWAAHNTVSCSASSSSSGVGEWWGSYFYEHLALFVIEQKKQIHRI